MELARLLRLAGSARGGSGRPLRGDERLNFIRLARGGLGGLDAAALFFFLASLPVFFFPSLSLFFFLFALVKAVVPRYRYDQLMRLGWKIFLPLSLIYLVIVAAYIVFIKAGGA